MNGKKWYYARKMAEGAALFFVELTDQEADVIRSFLDKQGNGPDEGDSGDMELGDESFNTREEVEEFTKTHSYMQLIWKYDCHEEDENDEES